MDMIGLPRNIFETKKSTSANIPGTFRLDALAQTRLYLNSYSHAQVVASDTTKPDKPINCRINTITQNCNIIITYNVSNASEVE